MERHTVARPSVRQATAKPRKDGALKAAWKRVRKPLAQSRLSKSVIASTLAGGLRFVRGTNRLVPGSSDVAEANARYAPAIVALWHGQHLLAPTLYPRGSRLVAMVSRSADAELNALVIEKFGFRAVRGSGGRDRERHLDKGGAGALIALKKAIDDGSNVCMIADIPHGTPREAGMGIVTLARLTGRPIVPVAITTSRRKVLEKSWDRTTINLPFGRCAIVIGDPVLVAADASDAVMELSRIEVTARLNAVTAQAERLVDRPR